MMRLDRTVSIVVPTLLLMGSSVLAQTPAAPASPQPAFYVQVSAAATLGHKSASAFGAEIGYRLTDAVDLFLEGGHMGNITTSDVESRADRIAVALSGTANVVQKANFGDIGIRYHLMTSGPWRAYAAAGLGAASVNTETTFATNNPDVSVALGSDLQGHVTKPLFVLGAGVVRSLGKRYFGDLSYRYGRIFPRSSEVADDKGNNTQRVQIAVGIRF